MGKKPGGCKMELFHFEKRNENYRKIKKKFSKKICLITISSFISLTFFRK